MNEQDYYTRWQQNVAAADPFTMAKQAGSFALEPATVFMAGYQAAIRATFPELGDQRWYSFAVSEDRSENSTRPGVTLDAGRITGFKTWIAAVNCVDALVVKVGSGGDACYGVVSSDDEAVHLTANSAPRFLAAMSQGQAEFTGAQFTPLEETSGVNRFRHNEPYYIYIAFLACVSTQVQGLSQQAEAILGAQARTQDLAVLGEQVGVILAELEKRQVRLGDNWETDQRLLTMYR
jgi:hypothetical protein